MANAQVTISYEAWCTIGKDIAQRPQIEACGVLLGSIDEQGNWYAAEAHPLRNIFASASYFEFDPEELLTIELSYPDQIIGVYHSHPTGFARASNTDRENMQRVNQQQQIPWVWLIARGPFHQGFDQQELSMLAYHHYDREGLCKISIRRPWLDTPSTPIETVARDGK